MKDFFISYNKADRAWAEWIAWVLEEAGYKVVIQAWDFRPGSNFVLEMNKGLQEAERVLAVLSPDFLASEFTAPEWAAAFAQDPMGKDAKLVPVRVREADLSGLLGQINYIDLVGVHDEAITRTRLLEGVERGRAKPKKKPAFPGAPERTVKSQPRFPGSLPPIWNVPHNRNRNFTGRDELLSTLRSQLLAGHHSALTALHGLGGIGKTQTAVEYAYRYASEYEFVWWLRSEDPAPLAGDYALLASRLGLPEAEADQGTAIQAVKEWLGVTPGWLLVFDNARDEDEVRSYLPAGNAGHVIITSRSPDWRRVAEPLSVGTLASEDAIDFLHKRSGTRDEQSSRELVEELGHLPLAIEQAAAYIDEHGRSISDYLALFRKHRQNILNRGQPSLDYPATLETTWELSFTEVRSQSPAGADLLNLCAFLAPDDIPLDIIKNGKKYLPRSLASAAADDLEFDDAVSRLRRHSLIERTEDALTVHRLVQAVVRDRMKQGERKVWAKFAIGVIRDAVSRGSYDVAAWPDSVRLLAHATIASAHCEAENVGIEFAVYLLTQFARYLRGRADFAPAKALGEWSLKLALAFYGPDHPVVAAILSTLGSIHQALGELEEAREQHDRAVKICEAHYGTDDPIVAVRVNGLGTVLQDLGEHAAARRLYERALKIDEAFYGPNSPHVARDCNNLGSVIKALGNLLEAKDLYERALRIAEACYGPNHPKVAVCVNNLGGVFQELGEPMNAQLQYERALQIDTASYGADHPEVAIDVSNLGSVHQALGNLAEARTHYERALKIFETKLGSNHPNVEFVRRNLRSLQ